MHGWYTYSMKNKNWIALIGFIVLSQLAGGIGALFTTSAIPTWYAGITKPVFSPPNWVFGPVWTTLYLLMGISAFLVWQYGIKKKDVRTALTVFCVQLVLNSLWSIIFFGYQNPGAAFIEIILLWLSIFATMALFYKISKPASYLLLPYIAWVSFAGFLNYSIYSLNKDTDTSVIPAYSQEPVFCAQDVRDCPDGSYVTRTGPKCEFAKCSGQ